MTPTSAPTPHRPSRLSSRIASWVSSWISKLFVPHVEPHIAPRIAPGIAPGIEAADSAAFANRRGRIMVAWIAVLIWAGVIWQLGTDEFSANETGSFLIKWLNVIFADLDPRTRYRVLAGIRKSAHFVEYAILALLAFRAAWISASRNRLATAAWIALFLVAALASADEARQAFLVARTGSGWDVLLDVTGGCAAIAAALLVSRRVQALAATVKPADARQSG
jgi:VanZ family protein